MNPTWKTSMWKFNWFLTRIYFVALFGYCTIHTLSETVLFLQSYINLERNQDSKCMIDTKTNKPAALGIVILQNCFVIHVQICDA